MHIPILVHKKLKNCEETKLEQKSIVLKFKIVDINCILTVEV